MAFSQRRGMYGLNQETVEALQRDMNSVGGDRVRDKHRGSNGQDSSLRSPGRSPALSGLQNPTLLPMTTSTTCSPL